MNLNYDSFTLILDQVKLKLFLRFSCKMYKNMIKAGKVVLNIAGWRCSNPSGSPVAIIWYR